MRIVTFLTGLATLLNTVAYVQNGNIIHLAVGSVTATLLVVSLFVED